MRLSNNQGSKDYTSKVVKTIPQDLNSLKAPRVKEKWGRIIMSDFECPYCSSEIEPNYDNREPDKDYQDECESCGKKFVYSIRYITQYHSSKADCLNGGEHDWKPIVGIPREYFENKRRCSMCAKEITLKPEEVKNGNL